MEDAKVEDITISLDEMIDFIYKNCNESLSKNTIKMILNLQEEFLDSKGLIVIEEDEII